MVTDTEPRGAREEILSWGEFELALERAGVIADGEVLDEIVIDPHQEVKLKFVE